MTLQVETRPLQVETRPLTLPQLGEILGIPIVVRPWWGSIRAGHLNGPRRRPDGPWQCPGVMKRPEVQNGVVVFWEGGCRARYFRRTNQGLTTHKHRQEVSVLSVGETAMLVHCSLHKDSYLPPARTRFLVGMDDGHPFVAPVLGRLETVEEAFDWLVPKMVKEARARGIDCPRQGDWFFIPYRGRVKRQYPTRFVRPRVPRGAQRWSRPQDANFPQRNLVYSRAPLVMGWWYSGTRPTRHIGEKVIYRTLPQPLVKGLVTSPDHPPVLLTDWHIACRTRSTPAGNRDGVRPGAGD